MRETIWEVSSSIDNKSDLPVINLAGRKISKNKQKQNMAQAGWKKISIDLNTQALAIAVLILVLYFIFLYATKSAVSPEETLGHHMMNFSTPLTGVTNVLALALALAGGAIVFLVLREGRLKEKAEVNDKDLEIIKRAVAQMSKKSAKDGELEVIKKALSELLKEKLEREVPQEQELKILKKALTKEEKKALAEVEKTGEITQDSLRFRLGWSKAKTSAIISNLDRMGVVQRERQGKTYMIRLQKK